MIEASRYVLAQICSLNDEMQKNHGMLRILPEEGELGANQLQYSVVSTSQLILNNLYSADFYLFNESKNNEKKRFIILINNYISAFDDLSEVDSYHIYHNQSIINSGTFTNIIFNAKIKVRNNLTEKQLASSIFYKHQEADYIGHSYTELIEYFEPFSIFEIEKQSSLYELSAELIGLFLITFQKNLRYLNFDIETIKRYRNIILSCNRNFSMENILLSLTSFHPKHSFLELYRCVEGIFHLPRAVALKQALNLTKTGNEIALLCYSHLGWKRNEGDSLKKLFGSISDLTVFNSLDNVPRFEPSINKIKTEGINETSVANLCEAIYTIRNQFVHQFDKNRIQDIADSDIMQLIDFFQTLILDFNSQFIDDLDCIIDYKYSFDTEIAEIVSSR